MTNEMEERMIKALRIIAYCQTAIVIALLTLGGILIGLGLAFAKLLGDMFNAH